MAKGQFNNGRPVQIALGDIQEAATIDESLISQAEGSRFQAGEKATLSPQGRIINRGKLSASEYKALVMANLSGQNLLPEGNAIHTTYQSLYGLNSPALMAVTGANWLLAARTPYPRLRGANNLEIPENKLPQKKKVKKIIRESTTEIKYVCKTTDINTGFVVGTYYTSGGQIGTNNINSAEQFSYVEGVSSASCNYSIDANPQSAPVIINYNIPVEIDRSTSTKETVL